MNDDDYLKRILDEQTFGSGDPEMKLLRERIAAVKAVLRAAFPDSQPSLSDAGSLAKGTMVKESYDGDITCYFEHEDSEPGNSLKSIYDAVSAALESDYLVERKASALRIKDKRPEFYATDFHIDVVPGRFVDEDHGDVHIHQHSTGKAYLKTNLQVHIDCVKESGLRAAIRLTKLWNVRNGVGAKTFVLELLVLKLLEGKETDSISEQLTHLWKEFRDNAANLSVKDPANPNGNDLKDVLDACRWSLSSVARTTISNIDATGWESVFGPLVDDEGPDDDGEKKKAALKATVTVVATPTRPWCR